MQSGLRLSFVYDYPMKAYLSAFCAFITAVSITSMTCCAAEADKTPAAVGKIIALEGSASALASDGRTRALSLGSTVYLDDRISTRQNSKLQIMFDDESLVSQGENGELVIDKYIFDPENAKKTSSSMKLIKGVFRVISGKVAEMNPDRFKVQTKMATIGIRGCELGFRVKADQEDIYIFDLPRGKSIQVWRAGFEDANQGGLLDGSKMLNIIEQGVAVSLRQGSALSERRYPASEMKRIVQESTPDLPSGSSQSQPAGTDSAAVRMASGGAQTASDAGTVVDQGVLQQALGGSLQSRISEIDAEIARQRALDRVADEAPPVALAGPSTPPHVDPPSTPPPVMVGGSPMNDWEWGIWESGTVQYSPNSYAAGAFLSQAEFQGIASGGIVYNLSGSGQAAAVLRQTDSGLTRTVIGSCNLNVQVGNALPPVWGGTFAMNNGSGDHLNFSVNPGAGGGTIGNDGKMVMGSPATYSMQLNGTGYASTDISSKSFEGQLIKPGVGTPPISAAAGKFQFVHSTPVPATASGAFGADLN